MSDVVNREAVLEALRSAAGVPLKAKDLSKEMGAAVDDRGLIRELLRELVEEGLVEQLESRRYVLARGGALIPGRVERKATGSAWFIPDDKVAYSDAFVPPEQLALIVDGDHVLAKIERAPKGPVARIAKIVKHAKTTVTGVLRRTARAAWVEADANVLSGPIALPNLDGALDKLEAGSVVEVHLTEFPSLITSAVGRVTRVLGKRGAIDVEIERLLTEKSITRPFPDDVITLAESFPVDPSDEDMKDREDLREMALCTIDGETAKDFDDAVHAVHRGKDIQLTVAIADVSHYVQQGSALDVEAARRGTSIYYPGRVIPMLPEALSNGLCSLRPHVNRLCMCAEILLDANGGFKKTRFFEGVMNSHARLTYNIVQKHLDGDAEATRTIPDDVQTSLSALVDAAKRLRKKREARGTLDFDLPETVIELDDKGEPKAIKPLTRLFSHKLIEDLMIAANEAVAEHFTEKGWPNVYRIHESPTEEKLSRFLALAKAVAIPGARAPMVSSPDPGELSAIMRTFIDHPAKQALDSLLLRSMMQAKYSADNVGHYGLGSEAYSHFTSPIRRYPDLVTHRLLRDRLRSRSRAHSKPTAADEALQAQLDDIAVHASDCERKATDLERAIDALHCTWFMKDKLGEVFDGVVGGVAEFGVFVRLKEVHVEGLIRITELPRDWYAFDEVHLRLVGEHTRRVITVGDELKVRVAAVDLQRRQIALAWVASADEVKPKRNAEGDDARFTKRGRMHEVNDIDTPQRRREPAERDAVLRDRLKPADDRPAYQRKDDTPPWKKKPEPTWQSKRGDEQSWKKKPDARNDDAPTWKKPRGDDAAPSWKKPRSDDTPPWKKKPAGDDAGRSGPAPRPSRPSSRPGAPSKPGKPSGGPPGSRPMPKGPDELRELFEKQKPRRDDDARGGPRGGSRGPGGTPGKPTSPKRSQNKNKDRQSSR